MLELKIEEGTILNLSFDSIVFTHYDINNIEEVETNKDIEE